MAQKSKVHLVADDNGYADHKLAFINGTKIECIKIPTSVQIGGSSLTSVDGTKSGLYNVQDISAGQEGGFQTYFCSAAVTQPLNLRNSEYPFSEANRVLMHHALHEAGFHGKSVVVGVTLPFRDFYTSDGGLNTPYHHRTIENFMLNNVEGQEGGKVKIDKARVFPEALSAFYDWGLDDEGNMTPGYEDIDANDGSVLVVDIGGSTTDIVCVTLIDGNLMIDHSRSGTEKVGVLDVKEKINEAFQALTGVGHSSVLSQRAISKIMETGMHRSAGREVDMRAQVDQILKTVTHKIVTYLQSKAGSFHDYQAIRFVGGGAVLFGKALKTAVPAATMGDEFANARGVLKYMLAQQLPE